MDRRFAASAANWKLEQKYETQGPRLSKKHASAKVRRSKSGGGAGRLPIKKQDGTVVAVAPSPEVSEDESEEEEREKDVILEVRENGEKKKDEEEEEEKPKVPEKIRVIDAKEELARIASQVQEDPEENVSKPPSPRSPLFVTN